MASRSHTHKLTATTQDERSTSISRSVDGGDVAALTDRSASKRGDRPYYEREFRVIAPHSAGPNPRSASVSFMLPPAYKRLAELLYSDARTPWKTESDVFRAFVDYGAEYFGAAVGGKVITGIRYTLKMMNDLIDQARDTNDFVESIEQLDREVTRLMEGQMRESAVGLVYQYRERAKAIDDKILRRKVVADINQRFAYLLKGNQGRKDHEKSEARLGRVDPDAESERGGEENEG